MATEDTVRIRRTNWNKLITGEVQGHSEGSGFRFGYSDPASSHLDAWYERWTDDSGTPEEVEAQHAESDTYEALKRRVEKAAETALYNGCQPWVELSRADFELLRKLTEEADTTLLKLLTDPAEEEAVTISWDDYDTLTDLAQLLTRDMPGDEPSVLDYGYIIDRYSGRN